MRKKALVTSSMIIGIILFVLGLVFELDGTLGFLFFLIAVILVCGGFGALLYLNRHREKKMDKIGAGLEFMDLLIELVTEFFFGA